MNRDGVMGSHPGKAHHMRPKGYRTPPRRLRNNASAATPPTAQRRCVTDPMTGFAFEPLRDEDMQRAYYGAVKDIKS